MAPYCLEWDLRGLASDRTLRKRMLRGSNGRCFMCKTRFKLHLHMM
jgi:hypothetical protein